MKKQLKKQHHHYVQTAIKRSAKFWMTICAIIVKRKLVAIVEGHIGARHATKTLASHVQSKANAYASGAGEKDGKEKSLTLWKIMTLL
jgi:hypothetical protein